VVLRLGAARHGPILGFQETWLTMAGSIFEMALYPNLCVAYISRFLPGFASGHKGKVFGFAMIALCTAWNIFGVRALAKARSGSISRFLAPFVALIVLALEAGEQATRLRFRCAMWICWAAC